MERIDHQEQAASDTITELFVQMEFDQILFNLPRIGPCVADRPNVLPKRLTVEHAVESFVVHAVGLYLAKMDMRIIDDCDVRLRRRGKAAMVESEDGANLPT